LGSIRPDAVPGLQIGASYYHDKISNFMQGPSLRYGQSIVNGYVVYVAGSIEFLNEGFLIRDAALQFSNAVFNTPAFYSQVSRKIGPVRPFLRYQYVNASPNNSIYNDVGLRFGPSFGVRYDLNDYVALKAQLDHTFRGGEPALNGLHLQWAFTF
jgi:outer membrane receptor protein involved in Fe transport